MKKPYQYSKSQISEIIKSIKQWKEEEVLIWEDGYDLIEIGVTNPQDGITLIFKGQEELSEGFDDVKNEYYGKHISDYYVITNLTLLNPYQVTENDVLGWTEEGWSPWEGDTKDYNEYKKENPGVITPGSKLNLTKPNL